MLRGLVADACLARKKNQAFWMCALPLRMKVIIYRDFPLTGGGVDMTLSPTRFLTLSETFDKVARDI